MNSYLANRINRLCKVLDEKEADAFITASDKWIYYLTGLILDKTNPVVIYIKSNGDITFIVPQNILSRDMFKNHEYSTYSADSLQIPEYNICNILNDLSIEMGECVAVSLGDCPGWLLKHLIDSKRRIVDLNDCLKNLVMIKDEEEINAIRNTLALNAAVYDRVKANIKQGVTEIDLYGCVSQTFNNIAGKPIEFISDLLSGPRTLEIGGSPSMKTVQNGETVIFDLLPCREGYYCDTTRTFFTGSAGREHIKVYNTLLKALKNAEASLKPGVMAETVYTQVSKKIAEEGFGGFFPHHAGHGIGLTPLEAPYFIRRNPQILEPGMVVTIEPGIYIPGKFGARIENNYLITADGFELLFDYPLEIDKFIIERDYL